MTSRVEEQIVGIAQRDDVYDGVRAMLSRGTEFPSPVAATLAGLGVQPKAREMVDDLADREWLTPWAPLTRPYPEVVIGSGPHALIYAAIRSKQGIPVLVLERNKRAGGSFACSGGPAFWLNSRNRPGQLSLPSQGKGLNVLPGCELQPSMIGGGEYQTNDELAWTIRMNLMMLPKVEVHTGVEVLKIEPRGGGSTRSYNLSIKINNGGALEFATIIARRVVVATGLGDERPFSYPDDKPERLLSFMEFMARMDDPFPLRGMDRVAVVGGGDSGKTAIEALTGQGPSTRMSVAALDYPRTIAWFGAPFATQADWCANIRGRYARIGKFLGGRVVTRGNAPVFAASGFESVQIGLRSYDYVINCIGYTSSTPLTEEYGLIEYAVGDRLLGRRVLVTGDADEVYLIGPAAQIGLGQTDRQTVPALERVPENVASLWRYGLLTAAFANQLPKVTA